MFPNALAAATKRQRVRVREPESQRARESEYEPGCRLVGAGGNTNSGTVQRAFSEARWRGLGAGGLTRRADVRGLEGRAAESEACDELLSDCDSESEATGGRSSAPGRSGKRGFQAGRY